MTAATIAAKREAWHAENDRVLVGQGLTQREREALGLVSVPTTRTACLPQEFVEANRIAAKRDLRKVLDVFELDPAARRYSNLRMAIGFAARAHAVSRNGFRSDRCWMVTLTYAGTNEDWRPDHMSKAMAAFKMWAKRRGFPARYVWVAELQKRGVIHYHVAAWLPKGITMPKWDKQGWWHCGMTNTLKAKHASAYLMSYLKKGDLEDRGALPKGARNYGVGGLDHSLRRARRWLRLPAFVQGNSSIYDDWRRADGGGWTSPAGEHVASEFETVFVGGSRCLRRVHRHPVSIEATGPFSWITDRSKALARP